MTGPTNGGIVCQCGRIMGVVITASLSKSCWRMARPTNSGMPICFGVPNAVPSIAGFAQQPFAEHYQPSYHAQRERLAPIYQGGADR